MAEFRLGKLEYSGRVGRSVAVPELVCRVATLFEDGIADLSFHAPANGRIRPDGGFDSTFHEQGRAELIESELVAGRFVIALSGWIHVQNAHNRTGGRLDAKAGYFREVPCEVAGHWVKWTRLGLLLPALDHEVRSLVRAFMGKSAALGLAVLGVVH